MNKTAKKILGLSALCTGAAAAAAGIRIYQHFLPRPERESGYRDPHHPQLPDSKKLPEQQAEWPYALLLGCPNRPDGSWSSSQIARCELAIEAWNSGLYDTLIISGASVKNRYSEAGEMARYITEHSEDPIPVILETEARNTWENIKNTRKMIGNVPVLILTSSLHARRAAAMASRSFSRFSILTCPDRKLKHIAREAGSRWVYIKTEISKFFTLA